MTPANFTQILNALGLLGLTLILLTALLLQFILGELPCPLCLLQRVGMVAAGFGLFLNLRFGPHPAHYGVVLLGALFGAATATRQILLHIVPGSGEYGSPLLGFHLYTWCLVIFMLAIAAVYAFFVHDVLWSSHFGINLTLAVLLFLGMAFVVAKLGGVPLRGGGRWLAVPIVLFAVFYF